MHDLQPDRGPEVQEARDELAARIQASLTLADELELHQIGIHLSHALELAVAYPDGTPRSDELTAAKPISSDPEDAGSRDLGQATPHA